MSAIDIAELADYGIDSCDVAVERIQQTVADELAAGTFDVGEMSFDPGFELLGVYNTYLADVREGTCPADALGNDEFGFVGSYG